MSNGEYASKEHKDLRSPDPLGGDSAYLDEEVRAIEEIESVNPYELMLEEGFGMIHDDYVDPEFSPKDIATEKSKDLKEKASQEELPSRKIRFIVTYYKKRDYIRNVIVDFEDALPENMLLLGKELLARGFFWAAEEARAILRNKGYDLPIREADMISAAKSFIRRDKPEEVRRMISRFKDSHNLDKTPILTEEVIKTIEALYDEYIDTHPQAQ